MTLGTESRSSRSFASAVFWNSTLMVVGLPVGIATAVLIGRFLGPAGKGEYTLATLVGGLLFTLFNLGIPTSISFYLSVGRAPESSLVRSVVLLAGILAAAGILIVFLFDGAGWSSVLLGTPRLSIAVWVAVWGLPFHFLGTFLQFVILAQGRRVLFAVLPVFGALIVALIVTTLVLLGRLSPAAATGAHVVSHVVTSGILLSCVTQRIDWLHAPLVSSATWRGLIRYSGLTYVAQNLQFLIQRADVFLLSAFLDLRAVGLYSVAYGIAELLLLLPQRFGNLYLPRVAGELSPQEKAAELPLSSSLVFVGTVISAVVLSFIAPFGIRLFYGNAFAPSIKPFLLLLPGICAMAASSIQGAYLSGVGKVNINATVAGVGLMLNIFLNFLLIPPFGISGAAVASSLTYCAQAFVLIHAVARITNSRPLAMLTSAPPSVIAGFLKRALR